MSAENKKRQPRAYLAGPDLERFEKMLEATGQDEYWLTNALLKAGLAAFEEQGYVVSLPIKLKVDGARPKSKAA